MVSVNLQIGEAVWVISRRRAVFTVADIAAYANLEGAETSIRKVLQRQHGDLLNIDPHLSTDSEEVRYIRQINVEKWWVRQTLRWADSGLDYLTEDQLASTMSLAFDECRWSTPPEAILQAGRRWAMVSEGCVPGTYVFPWASALRANPQLAETFISILDPQSEGIRLKSELDGDYQQYQWQHLTDDSPVCSCQLAIITAANEALNTLDPRQADVIRGRLGFDTGHKATLEDLGLKFGVTRERVRQIEKKALKKLKGLPAWHYGFVAHFILSGGSLLIPESEITPQWELFSTSIGLDMAFIPELGLHVLGASDRLSGYREYLDYDEAISRVAYEEQGNHIFEGLRFLPRQDAARLTVVEQEYQDQQKRLFTRPRMAYEALRSLGRAAHFHEISEEANRLFPDRQCSTHSWHASLQLRESLSLGIVWIGKKGMYGLEEHGYSRPIRDMFEAAASIVEAKYAETGQPVSYDFVMRELSRERQDPTPASVGIALSINNRLKPVGHGKYVPAARATGKQADTANLYYDFDAGFDAFLSDDDDE